MAVLDTDTRIGETDLTQSYQVSSGKDDGAGTFVRGTVTRLPDRYHVQGASEIGYNFKTFVDAVYINYRTPLDLDVGETFDLMDLDFRLGDELHLRTPPNK